VKGYLKEDPTTPDSYRFAPAFARTMNESNEALNPRLSDHAAINVDLPITQPALTESKNEGSRFESSIAQLQRAGNVSGVAPFLIGTNG
jgi:hypothetical protein